MGKPSPKDKEIKEKPEKVLKNSNKENPKRNINEQNRQLLLDLAANTFHKPVIRTKTRSESSTLTPDDKMEEDDDKILTPTPLLVKDNDKEKTLTATPLLLKDNDKDKILTPTPVILNKSFTVFNYDFDDRGPYIVYVDLLKEANDDGKGKPINQLRCASILNNFGCRGIISIHKIGYRRCKVTFSHYKYANWLANNKEKLTKEHNLSPAIFERFALKFGLVFGIPEEYSDEELLKMAANNPLYPVKSITRITKKNHQTGEIIKTSRIKVGFKSTIVPEELKLGYAVLNCKYYFPMIRQCFNCQKFGHLSNNCKQKEITCVNCAGYPMKKIAVMHHTSVVPIVEMVTLPQTGTVRKEKSI